MPYPGQGGIKATYPGFIEPGCAIGEGPNGERLVHEC
jgi:hypothetical protein